MSDVLAQSEQVVREKLAAGDLRAVGYSLPVVLAEYDRRGEELASLREQLQSVRGVEQHAEQEAYDHWCAMRDGG